MNDKWFGIIFLLIIVIFFSIIAPLKRRTDDNIVSTETIKEGFWGKIVKSVKKVIKKSKVIQSVKTIVKPWVDKCDWACKQRKRLNFAALLASIALAKEKKNCINDGGAWDGSNCHKYKSLPKNIFKGEYKKPKISVQAFCDKDPSLLRKKCGMYKNRGKCNKRKCCNWCKSKNTCIPYSYITATNTIDNLEC